MTLPIYDSLELSDVETICDIIQALQQRTANRTDDEVDSRALVRTS